MLYLVDGIWGSTNWGHPPIKWRMTPFNDDWPNSLFLSQDPVAIESVCYDFLFKEFDENHPSEGLPATSDKGPFSRFEGADDFLLQAASSDNWPKGFEYDPEYDGTVLTSLGTHEHWNSDVDKQYSRNLGTGNGIELVSQYVVTSTEPITYLPEGFDLFQNYPNPFSESTTISFRLAVPSAVQMKIYSTNGELIHDLNYAEKMVGDYTYIWNGNSSNGKHVPAGSYICTIRVSNEGGSFEMSNKMLIIR